MIKGAGLFWLGFAFGGASIVAVANVMTHERPLLVALLSLILILPSLWVVWRIGLKFFYVDVQYHILDALCNTSLSGRKLGQTIEFYSSTDVPLGTLYRHLARLHDEGMIAQDEEKRWFITPRGRLCLAKIRFERITRCFGESVNAVVEADLKARSNQ